VLCEKAEADEKYRSEECYFEHGLVFV